MIPSPRRRTSSRVARGFVSPALISTPVAPGWAYACSIDCTALLALDYLRSRIAVPDEISVGGCDDMEGGRERARSTYWFDMETMAHTMIAYVLNPSYGPLHHSRIEWQEIEVR
ncbi:MAG: hypothetical protein GF331_13850 [Chitinivibrionales bacterium]|nr:hypothetical protein [Chitinivibrionales bacterium]